MQKNRILFISLIAFSATFIGCMDSPKPVAPADNSASANRSERSQSAIAHSSDSKPGDVPKNSDGSNSGMRSSWSRGGSYVDVSKETAAIEKAEKDVTAKPNDGAARITASKAYLARANKLTEAQQYASALGDYRKALKYDPTNAEAKDWIDQIVKIYDSINKSYPAEGEEPPPLTEKKQ